MSTVQQVLDDAYFQFLSGGTLREARAILTTNIADTTTSFDLAGAQNNIGPGTVIAVDLEEMTVASQSGPTVTVIRGDRGSTAAAHDANTRVWINPKWSQFRMYNALLQELDRFTSRGMFQMKTFDLRFVSSRRQYDIPIAVADEWISDYRVAWETTDSSYMWPWIRSYEIVRGMPKPGDVTDDAGTPINKTFPSGFSILLHEGGVSGRAFRIWYRARYDKTAITSVDDDLSLTGLHTEAHDIAAMGIGMRLLPAREIARNLHESQGPTRRAEEVPPGAEQRAPIGLMQLYEDRIEDEVKRLGDWWPRYGNFNTQTLSSLSMGTGMAWG